MVFCSISVLDRQAIILFYSFFENNCSILSLESNSILRSYKSLNYFLANFSLLYKSKYSVTLPNAPLV